MKMIKDNLAGQELRISGDTIDILVDCCSGTFRILPVLLCSSRMMGPCIPMLAISSDLSVCHHQLTCYPEFVKMLYTEANEVCTNEKKNTIVPDHVFKAVEQLDLKDWMEPLQKALVEYKDMNKPAKPTNKCKTQDMNDDELVRSSAASMLLLQPLLFYFHRVL